MILKVVKLQSSKELCNFENFIEQSYLLTMNSTQDHGIFYTNLNWGMVFDCFLGNHVRECRTRRLVVLCESMGSLYNSTACFGSGLKAATTWYSCLLSQESGQRQDYIRRLALSYNSHLYMYITSACAIKKDRRNLSPLRHDFWRSPFAFCLINCSVKDYHFMGVFFL